ncbi:MAG: acetyltransferase [Cyanobacteria bacterium RYN_339]|nr:acetyltransferase [Cyanobacteria bacterium RYN_339]
MLRGPRVSLRPVERSQIPKLQTWFSQYELMRVLNPAAIRLVNLEAEEAWFDAMMKDTNQYLFAIHAGGELVGTTSLMQVNGKNRTATLGISIADPAARGHGYGSETLDLLLEFGFLELNLNRIQLYVMEFNPDARRLYERVGFKLDGTLRQSVFREGKYWDEHVLSMLRAEYQPDPHWGIKGANA